MTVIEIRCEREVLLQRHARRPLRDRTQYTCVGPDGTWFKHTNKAELAGLLRHRYGKVELVWPEGIAPPVAPGLKFRQDGDSYEVRLDGKLIGNLRHIWTTGGCHVWRGEHVNGTPVSSFCRTRKEASEQLVRIEQGGPWL